MPTEVLSNPTTPRTGDTNRALLIKILNAGVGSGSSSGSVLAGNYGGVAPAVTPTGAAIAKDTVTGQLWYFDGTSWA